MRKNLKFFIRTITVVFAVSGLFFMQSCENNPNDLGLEFILSDTLNTKVLDSNKDTLQITHNNFKKFVNTYTIGNFFVGKSGGYESKSLLKFKNLSQNYQGGTVYSATLRIHYNKYAFTDSLGTVSFNMYPLNTYYDYSTMTLDTFSTSSVGSTLIGTYTGAPTDTNAINISLNPTTVKNWLEYSADTTYSVKNFGMAILPNSNCNTIKAFSKSVSGLVPRLTIVVNKNNSTDTLTYEDTGYLDCLTFCDAPATSVLLNDRIVLQNGIIYSDLMNFNISKLPGRVTINEAYIRLKLDKANSITTSTNPNIYFVLVSDSAAKTYTGDPKYFIQDDSVTYSIRVNNVFQAWNYGTTANLGLILRNIGDIVNMDKFVFYGPSVQDTAKRPKLVIRYTPRGQ